MKVWKYILKFSDCAYCEPIFTWCVKRTPQFNLKNKNNPDRISSGKKIEKKKKTKVGKIE